MSPKQKLDRDKPDSPGPRLPRPIRPQTRRRWRWLRRAATLASTLVGIWLFMTDKYWISRSLAYLFDRPSSLPPSAREKAKAQEVADLLLEVYQTLAEMTYLDPLCIKPGPHDLSHVQDTIDRNNLDPSIVYLYSILPYIDADCGQPAFFQGGHFTDFRLDDDLEQGRDPFYANPQEADFADEDGPYMRPWVTPLSQIGNHQSVIIYNIRSHRIWIIDQEDWSSSDPALEGLERAESNTLNQNAFDHLPSRPAVDVLKDINQWYRQLKILPGGGDDTGPEWDHHDMDLPSIYRKNGWPNHFDGAAFEVDQARKSCAVQAKYYAEEPLRVVAKLKSWTEYSHQDIERARAAILNANSEEEKETAKFALWKSEDALKRAAVDLVQATEVAERYCPSGVCQRPEDLPLWEYEIVQSEYKARKEFLKRLQEEGKTSHQDPEFRRAQKEVAIFEKAFVVSKAASEGLSSNVLESHLAVVRPKGTDSAQINRLQNHADSLREYLATVPASAHGVIGEIQSSLEQFENVIASQKASLLRES